MKKAGEIHGTVTINISVGKGFCVLLEFGQKPFVLLLL